VKWKIGLEMRAREINEAGGIHGRKIRVVVEDNAYDPKKAIMVTNKMISRDKVFAFVGNMGSPTAGATKPIISRKKIPQLAPATAASLFFDPIDRYSFAAFTPYYDQARALVKFFYKEKGYRKFGLMYQDDEMGSIMKKGVEDQLDIYNLKLAGSESYKRGATEFSSQITKLRKAECEVVVLATIVREAVGALKEAHKIGWKVDFAGLTPTQNKFIPILAEKAGITADGLYSSANTPMMYADSPLQSVRDFWKRHVEWYDQEPDTATAGGYVGIELFRLAAEQVGRDLTREKWIDAMESLGWVEEKTFGSVPFHYSPTDHQGMRSILLTQVQNGKYVRISDGYIDYRE
jgi:ABC-type branched-subunit amino acid transport system substrate-binding protein